MGQCNWIRASVSVAGSQGSRAPPQPRGWDTGPVFRCGCSTLFSQAGVSQGCGLELIETLLVFVQVFTGQVRPWGEEGPGRVRKREGPCHLAGAMSEELGNFPVGASSRACLVSFHCLQCLCLLSRVSRSIQILLWVNVSGEIYVLGSCKLGDSFMLS